MEETDMVGSLFSILPLIIPTIATIVATVYAYRSIRIEGNYKSIEQLQNHIDRLMERIDSQDATIDEERKSNQDNRNEMNTKLNALQMQLFGVESALQCEKNEKKEYKKKYEAEQADKMAILEENRTMKDAIRRLELEIQTLKAQLGITAT